LTGSDQGWTASVDGDVIKADFGFEMGNFFRGFVKDTVFVPPLPANLRDLPNRITSAVALVNRDMLTRVGDEMDYRIDVCRISKGGHIEHL
jgi:hypothetical protein